MLLTLLATVASGQTPDQQRQIEDLLEKAVTATAPAEAEAIVLKAQSHLDSATRPPQDLVTTSYLQAEITRTRGKIHLAAWQQNESDDQLRQRAEETLSDAYRQYRLALEVLRGQQTARREAGVARPSAQARADQLEEYTLRLQYALAWTEYELGLVATDPHQRHRRFTDSIRRFASHFTATAYRSEPLLAHCFLGQALCLFELGQYSDALEFLKPAKLANTRIEIYQQMVELRIRSYQIMNDHKGAHQAAWEYLVTRPADRRDAADWRIALACARSLNTLAAADPGPALEAQYRASLEILAKEIGSAGEPWRSGLDAILQDAKGNSPFVCLSRARSKFAAKDYAAALAETEQGLASPLPAESLQATVADLRFVRAAALWELGRWLEAHREAAGFLKRYPADPRADRMAKCALQAGINALKADPPMEVAEFVKFVESAAVNSATTNPSRTASAPATSPAQTVGPEVAWYGGSVLLDRRRYPEAERVFQTVPAHSPFYLHAQYGLALARWKKIEGKTITASRPGQTQDPLAPTLAALTRFVQAARQGVQEDDRPVVERVVDLGTRVVMHLIEREKPDLKLAARLLDDIESLPQAKNRDVRLRLALRIEIAILAAGPDPDSLIVQYVAQKRPTTAELAGLLREVNKSVARRCRDLASRGRKDEATQLADALVNVYRRLLSRIAAGQSPEARQHEAAIHGQLARSLHELGRPTEAVTEYEWLEKNTPAGLSAEDLKAFAAAYGQMGKHDPAIGIWSRLSKSLPPHTEAWYEARYHLIDCYRQAGLPDHARDLLDYFLLQNPEIKVESWRQKFDDLKRVLPKRAERSGGKG